MAKSNTENNLLIWLALLKRKIKRCRDSDMKVILTAGTFCIDIVSDSDADCT